jgi:hypothetical protein
MKGKYFMRRLAVSPAVMLLAASAWFALNAILIGLGAQPSDTPEGVWQLGLWLGAIILIMFLFTNYKKGNN